MSVISGDMDPQGPKWYNDDREILRKLGYDLVASDDARNQYTQATDEIGLEYLRTQLRDPDAALERIPQYLKRFGDINRQAGILNRITTGQFGLIINIAARGYSTLDEGRAHFLHHQIGDFLGWKSSSRGGYVSEIRNPELLRDMVAQWQAGNQPFDGHYINFLEKHSDWNDVRETLDHQKTNLALFAITIPLVLTDPHVRSNFREAYPELSQQGIDIIAASLFNKGAHYEILSQLPGASDIYKDKNWESTIYASLSKYGPEYHLAILTAITEGRWQVFDDEELSFPGFPAKLRSTSFSLDENGLLVRETHENKAS